MTHRTPPAGEAREGYIQASFGRMYYLDYGSIDAPPMLMIMGLGCQLTLWPAGLVRQLMGAGFRVIRFDNRDIGLSDPADRGIRRSLPGLMALSRLGMSAEVNYTLYDMVEDTRELIDGLGVAKVHLVGASMGGMIAQLFASIYPQRVASLCSIMSCTNEPDLPMPRWRVIAALNGWGMPKGDDIDNVIKRGDQLWALIGSPGLAESPQQRRQRIAEEFSRSYRPLGRLRHAQAITATGGFSRLLARIDCPTQILHGDKDPLVRVEGGIASANAIHGAKLHIYKGMAHDLPPTLLRDIGDKTVRNARGALW